MKIRVVVAAVLAAGVALGTSGCNLIQPQATRTAYDASDGVGLNVGDLSLHNLMIISDNGETGNFLLSAVNNTGEEIDLGIGFVSGGKVVSGMVSVPSNMEYPTSWGAHEEDRILLGGMNVQPGGLLEVAFMAGNVVQTVLVPVLTQAQPEYEGLAPKKVTTITAK